MRLPRFPLHGFLYELRRGLLSPVLLVVLVLTVALGGGLILSITPPPAPQVNVSCSELYWWSGGSYHFRFHTVDQEARPVAGIVVNVTIFANSGGAPPLAYLVGHTGENGTLVMAAAVVEGTYNVSLQMTPLNFSEYIEQECLSQNGYWGQAGVQGGAPGSVHPLLSPIAFALYPPNYPFALPTLEIGFLGPDGSSPSGDQVYWAGPEPYNGTPSPGVPPYPTLPPANMTLLGTLGAPDGNFPLQVPGTNSTGCQGCWPPQQVVQIEIFDRNGNLLAEDTNASAADFAPPNEAPLLNAAESAGFSYALAILDLGIPLMAAIAAFTLYGRDRASGVLEATLTEPIGRVGLALSRYLATVTVLAVASLLACGVMDLVLHDALGVYLPSFAFLTLLAGILIAVTAVVGLVMLLSRFTRSTVLVLGIGIGLAAFFTLGWVVLQNPLASYLYTVNAPTFQGAINAQSQLHQIDLLNPVWVGVLAGESILNGVPVLGVGSWGLAAAGLLWTIAPLVLFLVHSRFRD